MCLESHRTPKKCRGRHLHLPVFGTDVRHDVLVEELEDQWDAVGKHQVLRDDLKLQERRRPRTQTKQSRFKSLLPVDSSSIEGITKWIFNNNEDAEK